MPMTQPPAMWAMVPIVANCLARSMHFDALMH
jgi:hypothetical protein